jgi:hypothetical protein
MRLEIKRAVAKGIQSFENTRKALVCYETHLPLNDKMHLKSNGFNPVICRYDEAIATLLAAEMSQMSFTGFPKWACSKNTDLPEANTIKNEICQIKYLPQNER